MIVFSEFILILCLTLCMGFALVQFISTDLDVKSEVSVRWLKWTGNGSILFAFLTILFITQSFSDRFHLAFLTAFFQVMYDTEAGVGWIGILAANTLLLGIITFRDLTRHRFSAYAVVVLAVTMLLSYARARHVSTLDPVWGFLSQAIHVLGVAVWLGLLLLFGWFTGNRVAWHRILKWFTPLSFVCMTAIIVAGLFVMEYTTPEYLQALILPYGQALLVKHLLMIPLLSFAFINGFLYYNKIKRDPAFNPLPWIRAESLVAIMLLLVTSYMSQQAPPHQVSVTLMNEKPSSLFLYWYQGAYSPGHALQLVPTGEGVVLALMSAFMFGLVVLCFLKFKRMPILFVSSAVSLGVISAYIAAMIMVR